MTTPPYGRGDFVDCLFPFNERRYEPGPSIHVAYVVRTMDDPQPGRFRVITLYTTTSNRFANGPVPKGVLLVNDEEAAATGMSKGFVIDARRIGFLHADERFFPAIAKSRRGIRGRAGASLLSRIDRVFKLVLDDPSIAESFGSWAPRKQSRR